MHALLHLRRSPRRTTSLLVFAIPLLIVACQASSAKDRGWTVRDPLWSALPQTTTQASAAEARAVAIARALGIPGNPSAPVRERDMLRGVDYDRVEFLAPSGDTTVMELNTETHAPIAIIRLGPPRAGEPATLTAATAPGRARAVAAILGLALPQASPSVRWQPGLEAWEVTWGREIDGHPAPGEGTVVDVTASGAFQSVTVTGTPAAPAPASPIPPDRAKEVASAFATQRQLTGRPGFSQSEPELIWVRPNNFLDPSLSDAPEPLLRLAYAVTFRYEAMAGDEPHQVVLWISAADGSLLGGAETA